MNPNLTWVVITSGFGDEWLRAIPVAESRDDDRKKRL
jgi:hypothetical protein